MNTLFVGLDVHKDTIAVAAAEEGRNGEVRVIRRGVGTPDRLPKGTPSDRRSHQPYQ